MFKIYRLIQNNKKLSQWSRFKLHVMYTYYTIIYFPYRILRYGKHVPRDPEQIRKNNEILAKIWSNLENDTY